jgi:hypothetical protein
MTSTVNNEESIDESPRQPAIDIAIKAEMKDMAGIQRFIS